MRDNRRQESRAVDRPVENPAQVTQHVTVPRRILTVYAHPDDEAFGPAAALARYAREGAKLYGIVFTPGQHGESTIEPPPSPTELARVREADLRDAAATIGYAEVDLLDYEDSKLDQAPPAELTAKVLEAIRRYPPEVVITFGPGGITHHPDHIAVHHLTVAAFRQAQAEGLDVQELYYDAVPPARAAAMDLIGLPDGAPNTWIEVAQTAPIQLAALRCYARHVQDARDMVARLEGNPPRPYATFYRAWPQVMVGRQVTRFMEGIGS